MLKRIFAVTMMIALLWTALMPAALAEDAGSSILSSRATA